MKSLYKILSIVFPVILFGCQQQQTLTDAKKEIIRKEVTEQYNQLVTAINQLDARAWSEFYSKDEFISAFAGTEFFTTRSAWVDTITNYFSMRESQKIEPTGVQVTALAPDLALLTSQEKTEMQMKSGKEIKFSHVFTMIWKKEPIGWKILHSHESWVEEQVQ